MTSVVTFRADGVPQPKGSTRALLRQDGTPKVVNDNQRTASWASTVGWSARAAGVRCSDGFVEMTLTFALVRPQRPPTHGQATRKPDLDKLVRAVLDALTGIAYNDDAQVTRVDAVKHYAPDQPGVLVTIRS